MPKFKPLPSLAALQQQLSYDPETGLFTWENPPKTNTCSKPGDIAGSRDKATGYVHIGFMNKRYAAHRLAWLYISGDDPGSKAIDHINGDKTNNSAKNLRLATPGENQWNARGKAKGWLLVKGRYQARIQHEGHFINLGCFDTAEQAHEAYVQAANVLRPDWTPLCYNGEVSPTTND